MFKLRIPVRSRSVPKLALVAGLCFVTTKVIVASTRTANPKVAATAGTVQTAAPAPVRLHRHMHMKNWMLEPTGIPGVGPLDPTTIPKWVNQLTKPPVHVPVGAAGKPTPVRRVGPGDSSAAPAPGLSPDEGLRLRRQGELRRARPVPGHPHGVHDARADVRGGPRPHILVHFRNELEGRHIFPVDPTLMVANPNNAPMPDPPFNPFPPGYDTAQSPIPIVTHLHGGVTPSDSDGFVESWFTKDEGKKGPDLHVLHLRVLQRATGDDPLVSRPHAGDDAAQRRRRPRRHLPHP